MVPNAVMTCRATLPVGQAMVDAGEDIVNTVIATGQPPQGGAALSDSASATMTFTQEPKCWRSSSR